MTSLKLGLLLVLKFFPTSVDPVKVSFRILSFEHSSLPISTGSEVVRTENTPLEFLLLPQDRKGPKRIMECLLELLLQNSNQQQVLGPIF